MNETNDICCKQCNDVIARTTLKLCPCTGRQHYGKGRNAGYLNFFFPTELFNPFPNNTF